MTTSGIFISFPTTDLERSRAFYAALGFPEDPAFSDDNGACFAVGDQMWVMVVSRDFFATMTDKQIADPQTHAMVGLNLTQDSRETVDEIVERGLAAGGTEPRPAQDYGFMYSRDLDDPDGNNIGFLHMVPSAEAAAGQPAAASA